MKVIPERSPERRVLVPLHPATERRTGGFLSTAHVVAPWQWSGSQCLTTVTKRGITYFVIPEGGIFYSRRIHLSVSFPNLHKHGNWQLVNSSLRTLKPCDKQQPANSPVKRVSSHVFHPPQKPARFPNSKSERWFGWSLRSCRQVLQHYAVKFSLSTDEPLTYVLQAS